MATDKSVMGEPRGAVAGAREPGRRSGLEWALSVVISLEAVSVIVQAITAGSLLGGADGMKDAHAIGAGAVIIVALVQVVLAVLLWRPGRGPGWPALASLLLLAVDVVQAAVGGEHDLTVHVPLGVATFGIAVALTVWAWAPRRSPR